MTGDLVFLPLPIIVFVLSSVVATLMARAELGIIVARWLFVAFFCVIAVGTLLIGLRFGYGFDSLVPLQRVLPLFAGPLLYLGFAVFATKHARVRRLIAVHLGVALALAIVPSQLLGLQASLDWLILLSYLVYAVGLLAIWYKGPNHLIRARIEVAGLLNRWSLWAAIFLLSFLIIDTAIAVSFAMQRSENAMVLISYGSVSLLVCMIIVIVTITRLDGAKPHPAPEIRGDTRYEPLEETARRMLEESELYLDTDLTVDRLAKRLHVPARALSAAINQSQGMNTSQYVNGFRLRHAARLLRETKDSVSAVMEKSGFLTRSNFYREFQREFGQSPAAYRSSVNGSAPEPHPSD